MERRNKRKENGRLGRLTRFSTSTSSSYTVRYQSFFSITFDVPGMQKSILDLIQI